MQQLKLLVNLQKIFLKNFKTFIQKHYLFNNFLEDVTNTHKIIEKKVDTLKNNQDYLKVKNLQLPDPKQATS